MIVRAFTKIILELTLLLSVLLSVGYAIYLWIQLYYSGAIIFTIFAIISVIAYFPMRRRIPFSRELLLFVLKIASEFQSFVLMRDGADCDCDRTLPFDIRDCLDRRGRANRVFNFLVVFCGGGVPEVEPRCGRSRYQRWNTFECDSDRPGHLLAVLALLDLS